VTADGSPASDLVLALSTAADAEQAQAIARALVEERLIACANLVPGLTSIYRWRDAVQVEPEVLLVMKTRRSLVPRLKERLPELHSYEVPELVVTPLVDGLDPYCRWVRESTEG
jgi:periplasmic divalent cation tolerance protein